MGADFSDYLIIISVTIFITMMILGYAVLPFIDESLNKMRKTIGCIEFSDEWVCPDKQGHYYKDGIQLSVNVSNK